MFTGSWMFLSSLLPRSRIGNLILFLIWRATSSDRHMPRVSLVVQYERRYLRHHRIHRLRDAPRPRRATRCGPGFVFPSVLLSSVPVVFLESRWHSQQPAEHLQTPLGSHHPSSLFLFRHVRPKRDALCPHTHGATPASPRSSASTTHCNQPCR